MKKTKTGGFYHFIFPFCGLRTQPCSSHSPPSSSCFFLTLPSTPFPVPAPLFLEVSTGDISDEEVEGTLVTCGDRPLLEQGEPLPGKRMMAQG